MKQKITKYCWILLASMLIAGVFVGCGRINVPGGLAGGTPAVECAEHADADDNGLCDGCGMSVVVMLDLFAINDLHGKICDSDSQPGVDELTTYLKQAYATQEHVILLSAGDMWQGSS